MSFLVRFFSLSMFNRRWRLRILLVVPFLLQICTAVGLTAYLSLRNGNQAVRELATQLQQEASQQVGQHLDNYLVLPHKINTLNVDAIAQGELDVRDLKGSARHFWKQSQLFPQFSFIGYYLADNTASGAGRLLGGEETIAILHPGGQLTEYNYQTDSEGNLTSLVQQRNYDGVRDSWYQKTVKAGRSTWKIYTATDYNGYLAAAANAPIYDRNHRLLGIATIDLQLSEISQFLKTINISPQSRIAIIERNGELIASSSDEPVFFYQGKDLKRWYINDYPEPTLQAIARHTSEQFGKLSSLRRPQTIEFSLDGQYHFARVLPWSDRYGLDWLVLVTFPKSDFTAQIDNNTRTTILFCLGALVVAILLGLQTARWISQPISNLEEASQAIADGDIQQQTSSSFIHEIDSVGKSFNRMAIQVQNSFAALERSNQELETRVSQRTGELSDKNIQLQDTLAELQQAQARIVQAEKMSALGQVVAGIAHEINNPVNFIHGNLNHLKDYSQDLFNLIQLYQEEVPDPSLDLQEYLENIDFDFLSKDIEKLLVSMKIGTERIREIIQSLRNFSRLDETELKWVDLQQGIDSTLMIVQNRLEAIPQRPAIQVVKKYGEIPEVECYAAQLNQVFLHLLNNAIDALEEVNSPEIHIETESAGDRVRIRIGDNGIGIETEVRDRLFDPFFTTKPVGRGTGMGLAIAYQIVTEMHEGELTYDSTLGRGTQFNIEIPVRQVSVNSTA